MFEAHGPPVANRKARSVQEIDVQVKEGLDEVRKGVHRITVIAIEGDHQIAGGGREAPFVTAAITPHLFPDHLGAQILRHLRGAVGRVVVHHDHLVYKLGHGPEDLPDSLLLVQARNDRRDPLAFIHGLGQSLL